MPGSCTYRSAVAAKEWHNPGSFALQLEQEGGAVSLSLPRVAEDTNLCRSCGGTARRGQRQRPAAHFLGEKSTGISAPRREGSTERQESPWFGVFDKQAAALCSWLLWQARRALGAGARSSNTEIPGRTQVPQAALLEQSALSSQMWDNLAGREISVSIQRLGVWTEPCRRRAQHKLACNPPKRGAACPGAAVPAVLGSPHPSGQHADALER